MRQRQTEDIKRQTILELNREQMNTLSKKPVTGRCLINKCIWGTPNKSHDITAALAMLGICYRITLAASFSFSIRFIRNKNIRLDGTLDI